jgi:nicotinate-nucleotide pyrophosphorylase (carboxylating)
VRPYNLITLWRGRYERLSGRGHREAAIITTNAIVPEDHASRAVIIANEDGVIAGQSLAAGIFKELDKEFIYEEIKKDGGFVKKGDTIAIVKGKTRAVLTGERVALNILQRLSGIAT